MFDILNVLATDARDMFTPKPKKGAGTSNFKINAEELGGGSGGGHFQMPGGEYRFQPKLGGGGSI